MPGTGRLFPKSFEGQAPREFGIGANILKTRTFALTVARDLEEVAIGGSCLWAIAATSLTAQIDIRINDQLRDPVTFQQGMFIRGIPFSRVFVSHAAQAGETITLFFAAEQDVRNIEIVNPSIAFNNINVTKSTAIGSLDDLAVVGAAVPVIVLPANALRRRAYVSSPTTNINTLRIGTSSSSPTRGIPLAPGETLIIDTITSVYVYNPAGPNQTISRVWTED